MNEYNLNKTKFYLRYVDGILAAFENNVFGSGIEIQNLTLQTYHKSTYTGLLLNFKSLTLFSYKISLIKCLIDRSFKICDNWNLFHKDIENIKSNLIKNEYPPFISKTVIKKYLSHNLFSNQNQLKDTPDVSYFKLSYIGNFRTILKRNF